MPEIIFACDADNYVARQAAFRGPNGQEYYDGDYQILPGALVDVRIHKSAECSFPILNLWTRSELRFRRSWNHIRSDGTDLTVIWFVKRGRVALSNHAGRRLIESGECTITRSLQPFYMENLVDEDSVNEVLHVVVPTHLARAYIPDAVIPGVAFSFRHGDCRAAEQTFSLLYEEGEDIDRGVADQLELAACSAVGHRMAQSVERLAPRTLGERRFDDVMSVIQKHLTNPHLTPGMAAHACGISTRYLCYILRLHQTSFSEILWRTRLDQTKSWLLAENMRHVSVARIAYMAGFKSPAHFGRMFKRVLNTTPRDYRDAAFEANLTQVLSASGVNAAGRL